MSIYPANCERCGLCRECKSYKIAPAMSTGVALGKPVDVLFIGDSPGPQEDEVGVLLTGEAGLYLKDFLDCFEEHVTWAFTNIVRCHPRWRAPEPHEIAACEEFLNETISLLEPKVIVLLGVHALKAVWKNGPDTIARARVAPVKLGNAWVLTTYHPSNHVKGQRNLDNEYARVFHMVGRIVDGAFEDEHPDIRFVQSKAELSQVYEQVIASPEVCFDVETDTDDDEPRKATIWMPGSSMICMAIGTDPEQPVWVMPAWMVTKDLVRLLRGKHIVGQNIKYDIQAIAWWYDRGIWDWISGITDTMLWHASRDQGKAGNGLTELAVQYLGVPDWKKPVWDMVDAKQEEFSLLKRKETATLKHIPYGVAAEMCAKDVYYTMRLAQLFRETLPPGEIYGRLLLPALSTVGRMELRGLGASPRMRDLLHKTYMKRIGELQAALRATEPVRRIEARLSVPAEANVHVTPTGKTITRKTKGKQVEFNCRSDIHLEHLLRETGWEVTEKTKKSTYELDGEILPQSRKDKKTIAGLVKLEEELNDRIWAMVQAQRDHLYAISKFIIPYGQHIAIDNRIHARFNICKVETSGRATGADATGGGTDTGRLAVLDPALHNIKKDPTIRLMFGPRRGNLALEFDYGQIEPRMMAWLSGCQTLIDACSEGDIYKSMSALLKRKHMGQVTRGERTMMKVGVLAALLYGQSVANFSRQQGVPEHEAQEFFDSCRRRFPEVVEFQRDVIRRARNGETLVTVWGRKTSIEYRNESTEDGRKWNAHADIKAVNFLIQSPASDNTLYKAIEAEKVWKNGEFELVMLIHDAHVGETPREIVFDVLPAHKRLMEDMSTLPFHCPVPFPVEAKWGKSFSSAHMVEWAV